MKNRKSLTDAEVEAEIEMLRRDPDVSLGRLNERVKYKRRQYLYQLRSLQKQGRELRENGITAEMIMSGER